MEKPAHTSRSINELATRRWSPRAFLDQPVSPEKLISIFEAARWSASGGNEQPWRFIVGSDQDETWEKIFSTLDEGNQGWNGHVPVLIVAVGNKISNWDGNISPFFQYDTGQAVAHLSLEAVNQGLHVHQMGGFSVQKMQDLFEIPVTFHPLTVIGVGYIGDPDSLNETLKKREIAERRRKGLDEIVFSGKFGRAAYSPPQPLP